MNLFKRLMALCIVFSMLGSYAYTAEAVQDDTPVNQSAQSVEELAKDCIIVYADKPYYYYNGVKTAYDQNEIGYKLPMVGDVPVMSVSFLQNWVPFDVEWDERISSMLLTYNGNKVELVKNLNEIKVNSVREAVPAGLKIVEGISVVPFENVLKGLGVFVYNNGDGAYVISTERNFDIDADSEILSSLALIDKNIVLEESFENDSEYLTFNTQAFADTDRWISYFSNEESKTVLGITEEAAGAGTKSLYIDSIPFVNNGQTSGNNGGCITPRIPYDMSATSYELRFKVKPSDDFEINQIGCRVIFYDGSTQKASTTFNYGVPAREWKEFAITIGGSMLPESKFDSFAVYFYNAYQFNVTGESSGKTYWDDIRIECIKDGDIDASVSSSKTIPWYNPGETVVYKLNSELPPTVKSVKGIVKNSYGDILYTKTISPEEFAEKGFYYNPKDVGYYIITFEAETATGVQQITSSYIIDGLMFFNSERRFIVAEPTKPMEDRNEGMYVSHNYIPGEQTEIAMEYADLMGFRGVRVHPLTWGEHDSLSYPAIESKQGVYDWTWLDAYMEIINEHGFYALANPLYTPRWASPYPEKDNFLNNYPIYEFATYAPTDLKYYQDFIRAIDERYGDVFKIWEIYNEPHLKGSSVFWSDTPLNYAKLLMAGYEAVKEVNPDAIVTIGGVVGTGYLPFWEQVIKECPEVFDYFDYLAMHGPADDYQMYNHLAEKYGLPSKPILTSESHYLIFNSTDAVIQSTESKVALELLKNYFKDFKNGLDIITLFRLMEQHELETLPAAKAAGKRFKSFGIIRRSPVWEPRLCAMALHTLLEIMGKEISYKSEYLLGDNKQNVVQFINDEEPLLVLWNEKEDYTIDADLKKCFTTKTVITDWEGKVVSPDGVLHKETVYFIRDIDDKALESIPETPDKVLHFKGDLVEQTATEVGYGSKTPIFDESTFDDVSDITWNDTQWKYVSLKGKQLEGFGAKYAVGMSEKGLYLEVAVDDKNINPDAADKKKLYEYDSIQFAIDASGIGSPTSRVEFQAGMFEGKPVLYKQQAANIGGAIPSNWSVSGTFLNDDYISVTHTQTGILYKIFIPAGELYPLLLQDSTKEIRMSILANDNDGDIRRGYVEWSSGIGNGKNVGLYGKVILK